MIALRRGKFIVIDGPDGSGKTTQIELVRARLSMEPISYTREPGGVEVAEKIRALLMQHLESTVLTDICLFSASRFAHLQMKVLASLERGIHVLTDRFDSSTFAYQLWGDTGEVASPQADRLFMAMRQAMPADWLPDAYLLFDIPGAVARERRMQDTVGEKTRFDLKPVEYYENVRQGYLAFAKRFVTTGPCANGKNIHIIDANRLREEVQEDVYQSLRSVLDS